MSDPAPPATDSWSLKAYLAFRRIAEPMLRLLLRRRVARGKDDPSRFQEKLGHASETRLEGPLAWFHAVGLGEVLALRPLITAMQEIDPDLNILVTSSARSSAGVFGANLPPRTRHQFLPLDGRSFSRRFLDHWRPDISIWSEQDLWPGIICDTAAEGIPLAYVNVRMNSESLAKRKWAAEVYKDTLRRFSLLSAQDPDSAQNLAVLSGAPVERVCYLKPAAEPLAADEELLSGFRARLQGRPIWVAASTHDADEPSVIAAHREIISATPDAFLIIAPRRIDRAQEIAAALSDVGVAFAQRSAGEWPDAKTQVLLADSFGELGIWFRLASVAFIGGSMGSVGGHNPWEAICLGVPVIAGPNTANFERDYNELEEKGLFQRIGRSVTSGRDLAQAVRRAQSSDSSDEAMKLVEAARAQLTPLARDLVALMRR